MLNKIELLKSALTGEFYDESYWRRIRPDEFPVTHPAKKMFARWIVSFLERRGFRVMLPITPTEQERERRRLGKDHPALGFTMVGRRRLDNLEECIRTTVSDGIKGSVVECGVWRGGAGILAKAVLQELDSNKELWLCDSFEGLPPPSFEQDAGYDFTPQNDYLGVSMETVQHNFKKFGVLDARVRFLKGFFSETLQQPPMDKISVLRLDGDLYESTLQCLDALYHRVSSGGFVIIDDYGVLEPCRRAVHDYFNRTGKTPNIQEIDGSGVYLRV